MSELASAMFSIADASEFRFARFYSVCEAVMLETLKSPFIVCGLSDTPRGLSKRGKTQNLMFDAAQKNSSNFTLKNLPLPVASGTLRFSTFRPATYPTKIKRLSRDRRVLRLQVFFTPAWMPRRLRDRLWQADRRRKSGVRCRRCRRFSPQPARR